MATYTGSEANGETNGIQPSITLYTNHGCPWAHRAHIALKELGLSFEEVIIDLDTPREPWYLEINPRGLVPSIKYSNGILKDEIVIESAIVAQFLADSRPSHLLPPSLKDPYSPLFRARVSLFADAFISKVNSNMYPLLKAEGEEERTRISKEIHQAIETHVEPLLKDAKPFFGGSSEFTMAEVLTAPFVIRYLAYSKDGLFPKSLREDLQKLPNFGPWAEAVAKRESVTYMWDEQKIVERTKKRIAKLKEQAK